MAEPLHDVELALIREDSPLSVREQRLLITIDAERQRAEAAKQERDDWKATAEAALAEPQLKLLVSKLEEAEAQVERLRNVRDWVREQRQKTDDIAEDSLWHSTYLEIEQRLSVALAASEEEK